MRTIIILAVLAASISIIYSQSYTEAFDSVFVNISKVQATTGILYERVVPFANLVNYNSNVRSAVDTSNFTNFIQSYSELYRAAFDTAVRPPWTVTDFEEQIQNNYESDVIDIGILHYKFNVIDSAVAYQKLYFDTDSVLYEDTTITASLYLLQTAFVVSPLSLNSSGTNGMFFRFNSIFNFNNTGSTITLLLVDFDDGLGLRSVSMDSIIYVSYFDSGLKTLQIVATYSNGETFTAYASIAIQVAQCTL